MFPEGESLPVVPPAEDGTPAGDHDDRDDEFREVLEVVGHLPKYQHPRKIRADTTRTAMTAAISPAMRHLQSFRGFPGELQEHGVRETD
jgi:hypothetical protein